MCIRLHCKAGSDVHARTFHARIFALDAIAVIAGCVGVPEGIEPVTGFQVERYMGRWCEVAVLNRGYSPGAEVARFVAKAKALGCDTWQLICVQH